MKKLRNGAVMVVALLAALLLGTPQASAEDTICQGTIGAITLDNVTVPDGATCRLNGTTLQGTLRVGTGSTLQAQRISVNGNIQAEGSALVSVSRSTVGGSVQVVQGNSARLDRVQVTGDILLDENEGPLSLTRNTVNANVQVKQNTGGVSIINNRIAQSLQCSANTPAPTGGGNIAGDKEDQCEGL